MIDLDKNQKMSSYLYWIFRCPIYGHDYETITTGSKSHYSRSNHPLAVVISLFDGPRTYTKCRKCGKYK